MSKTKRKSLELTSEAMAELSLREREKSGELKYCAYDNSYRVNARPSWDTDEYRAKRDADYAMISVTPKEAERASA